MLAPETTALSVNDITSIPDAEPSFAIGVTYSPAPKATAIRINGALMHLVPVCQYFTV